MSQERFRFVSALARWLIDETPFPKELEDLDQATMRAMAKSELAELLRCRDALAEWVEANKLDEDDEETYETLNKAFDKAKAALEGKP